ncbi:hypothetical protein E4H12_01915 [Candidatus Thorarchaeota archaeon]|nr:MAG: hypothetical protein E4H12_01915 [Candidatus Thorarchaeota archaeon]
MFDKFKSPFWNKFCQATKFTGVIAGAMALIVVVGSALFLGLAWSIMWILTVLGIPVDVALDYVPPIILSALLLFALGVVFLTAFKESSGDTCNLK